MGHHILLVLESHSLPLVPTLTSATLDTSYLAFLLQHRFSNPLSTLQLKILTKDNDASITLLC